MAMASSASAVAPECIHFLQHIVTLSPQEILLLLTGRLSANDGQFSMRHDPAVTGDIKAAGTSTSWPAVSTPTNVRFAVRLLAMVDSATTKPGESESSLYFRHRDAELFPLPTLDMQSGSAHALGDGSETYAASKLCVAVASLIEAAKRRGIWIDGHLVAGAVCLRLGLVSTVPGRRQYQIVGGGAAASVAWIQTEIDAYELVVAQYAARMRPAAIASPEAHLRRTSVLLFHATQRMPCFAWPRDSVTRRRLVSWLLLIGEERGVVVDPQRRAAAARIADEIFLLTSHARRYTLVEALDRLALALLKPDALWNRRFVPPSLTARETETTAQLRVWLSAAPVAYCIAAVAAALGLLLGELARQDCPVTLAQPATLEPEPGTLTELDHAGAEFVRNLSTPLSMAFTVSSPPSGFESSEVLLGAAPPALKYGITPDILPGRLIRFAGSLLAGSVLPRNTHFGDWLAVETGLEQSRAEWWRGLAEVHSEKGGYGEYCLAGCHLLIRPHSEEHRVKRSRSEEPTKLEAEE